MSVQRDDLLRRHDIYALGCFEKKKTVYTQQARALTLIHALFKAGKIAKGTKIGIVGGGISGIAAAIAAKKVGARVVVVEKEENLIPIQRDCSHRYLHPHAYDWPAAWCNENNSGLPIDELNWEAGTAKEVTETLEDKFKKFVNKSNETGDLKEITFYTCWPARMLLFDRVNKKHVLSKRAFDRDGENWRLFERDPSWSGVVDECTPISDEFRAEREQWKSAASKLIRRIRHGDISLPPPYLSPKGRNGINGQTPIFWNGQEHFTFKGKEISAKAFPDDDINPDFIVDCDILIFATGFGIEDPRDSILNDLKNHFGHKKEFDEIVEKRINKLPLKNNGYWEKDRINEEKSLTNTIHETDIKENTHDKPPKLYVVSGSGDGALIDILRLLILDFTGPEYHRDLLDKLNALLFPRQAVGVWLSQKDVLVYAEALRRLFNSDDFKRTEGETDRLSMIGRTMAGFDIDAFLDHFSINLADAEVYNVSIDPQPFWTPASVAHRLLVWCLHKKGRVRFVRGRVIRYADKRSAIQRTVTGKWRDVGNSAIVARHGVARQSEAFLRIQGVLINTTRTPGEVAADGRRLVSLLRLSDRLHPETEKFFRHTIKHLR
ncbi:hypothetical protein PB2503_01307 [Parvularcula bermudensis HTCC2503]|uniref:Uncharacterized protein n=2 Tax=Parvularcula TaxID=208215 RepID=E0TBG5_PARBH|nr:hypothetical protein PB2503_01307 [Parvularcula bermudensis HTCC2503]